jgi:hypothetical protein
MLLTTPGCDQDATEEAVYQGQVDAILFLCACCLSVGATSSFALVNKVEQCACFGVKNIGKPYALIAHVRIDEGEQVMLTMVRLLRHRQTKGAVTDILDLRDAEPVLYSTCERKLLRFWSLNMCV